MGALALGAVEPVRLRDLSVEVADALRPALATGRRGVRREHDPGRLKRVVGVLGDRRHQPAVDHQLLAAAQVAELDRIDRALLHLRALAGDRQRRAQARLGDKRRLTLRPARPIAHEVDPALVAVDRLTARIGADDELLARVGLAVVSAEHQIDVTGLRVAGQPARVVDLRQPFLDHQHAVVVSVRLRLLAGQLLATERHRGTAPGRLGAVGEHQLGDHGRVIAVRLADARAARAVHLIGLQTDRDLDLGGRLEPVAVSQVAEIARLQ